MLVQWALRMQHLRSLYVSDLTLTLAEGFSILPEVSVRQADKDWVLCWNHSVVTNYCFCWLKSCGAAETTLTLNGLCATLRSLAAACRCASPFKSHMAVSSVDNRSIVKQGNCSALMYACFMTLDDKYPISSGILGGFPQ